MQRPVKIILPLSIALRMVQCGLPTHQDGAANSKRVFQFFVSVSIVWTPGALTFEGPVMSRAAQTLLTLAVLKSARSSAVSELSDFGNSPETRLHVPGKDAVPFRETACD